MHVAVGQPTQEANRTPMSRRPEMFRRVKCLVAVQPISMQVFVRTYLKRRFTTLGVDYYFLSSESSSTGRVNTAWETCHRRVLSMTLEFPSCMFKQGMIYGPNQATSLASMKRRNHQRNSSGSRSSNTDSKPTSTLEITPKRCFHGSISGCELHETAHLFIIDWNRRQEKRERGRRGLLFGACAPAYPHTNELQ
jgi:hypothetical protein